MVELNKELSRLEFPVKYSTSPPVFKTKRNFFLSNYKELNYLKKNDINNIEEMKKNTFFKKVKDSNEIIDENLPNKESNPKYIYYPPASNISAKNNIKDIDKKQYNYYNNKPNNEMFIDDALIKKINTMNNDSNNLTKKDEKKVQPTEEPNLLDVVDIFAKDNISIENDNKKENKYMEGSYTLDEGSYSLEGRDNVIIKDIKKIDKNIEEKIEKKSVQKIEMNKSENKNNNIKSNNKNISKKYKSSSKDTLEKNKKNMFYKPNNYFYDESNSESDSESDNESDSDYDNNTLNDDKSDAKSDVKSDDKMNKDKEQNDEQDYNEETLLFNLKIISELNPSDKLSYGKKLFSIDNPSYAQGLYRWWYGEDRSKTLEQLNKIIDATFAYMDKTFTNQVKIPGSSNNDEHVLYENNSQIMQKFYITLMDTIKGLDKLKSTYSSDKSMITGLNILMDRIRRRTDKIDEVLKIVPH